MFCYTIKHSDLLVWFNGYTPSEAKMNIGMLWFDNDNKSDLATKIQRAANYYHLKYGKAPNLCLVHPRTLGNNSWTGKGIEVRTTRSVLPNHFWLGVNTNGNLVKS
jgi:hypothetical protein